MTIQIPEAKIPDVNLPVIRVPVHIPYVGCPGADARSYIGEQFGNLPDLKDALHIKHLRKVINDQIYALIKGKLPTLLRAGLYIAKALELIQQIAEMVAVMNQVIAQAIAEYNATVAFVNEKISALNESIAALEAIPAESRSAVQQLTLERYNSYVGELNLQVTRLQTSITCILE